MRPIFPIHSPHRVSKQTAFEHKQKLQPTDNDSIENKNNENDYCQFPTKQIQNSNVVLFPVWFYSLTWNLCISIFQCVNSILYIYRCMYTWVEREKKNWKDHLKTHLYVDSKANRIVSNRNGYQCVLHAFWIKNYENLDNNRCVAIKTGLIWIMLVDMIAMPCTLLLNIIVKLNAVCPFWYRKTVVRLKIHNRLKEKSYTVTEVTQCHARLFQACLQGNWEICRVVQEKRRMCLQRTMCSIQCACAQRCNQNKNIPNKNSI